MISNVVPIHSRQQPIGTFHAVSCRDVASLDRDGEGFFEVNTLDTADGRPLVEINFADGIWLLADLVPGFCLDALPDRNVPGSFYGEPLERMGHADRRPRHARSPSPGDGRAHRWSGDTVHVTDEDDAGGSLLLGPDQSGGYDLASMG